MFVDAVVKFSIATNIFSLEKVAISSGFLIEILEKINLLDH